MKLQVYDNSARKPFFLRMFTSVFGFSNVPVGSVSPHPLLHNVKLLTEMWNTMNSTGVQACRRGLAGCLYGDCDGQT